MLFLPPHENTTDTQRHTETSLGEQTSSIAGVHIYIYVRVGNMCVGVSVLTGGKCNRRMEVRVYVLLSDVVVVVVRDLL